MLTTYLFRYTSECTISYSNFLRLRRQRGIDPANQNPVDVPAAAIGLTYLLLHLFQGKYDDDAKL